jgi:hypothetical protein
LVCLSRVAIRAPVIAFICEEDFSRLEQIVALKFIGIPLNEIK